MSGRPQGPEDLLAVRRQLEREREARASAEAATLARDQFLAIVSHELRSPLNGIKSWAHVLENHVRESDDPMMQRALAGIMIGVEQQVRLIDDLLDVTRALSGNLGLAKEPMSLAPVVLGAVEALRAVAAEKGVSLKADPSLVDAEIHGDSERIRQIFFNLVGNAIKFTPEGGTVEVGASIDGHMARVEVRDNGALFTTKHVKSCEHERVVFTDRFALFRHDRQPVRVHVLREPDIRPMLSNFPTKIAEVLRQWLRRSRERAVWRGVKSNNFGAECFDQLWTDERARAVNGIKYDAQFL